MREMQRVASTAKPALSPGSESKAEYITYSDHYNTELASQDTRTRKSYCVHVYVLQRRQIQYGKKYTTLQTLAQLEQEIFITLQQSSDTPKNEE